MAIRLVTRAIWLTPSQRESLALGIVLCASLAVRLIGLDQTPVENYVGRQVPTAMVARNLDRGGSWLRPELDTGPWPNLFVVEPPLFALGMVGVRRLTSLPLVACGRLLSALGIAIGGWGLYGLVRRREGVRQALLATSVFVGMPLTVRYGRAVQGDALMIGLLLASLRLWDDETVGRAGKVVAWLLLALGLSLKIIAAWVLIPLAATQWRRPDCLRRWLLALAAILPALAWYAHAASAVGHATGSRAASETARLWLQALQPAAWLDARRWWLVGRFVVVRSFTPLAWPLIAIGLRSRTLARPIGDRFWTVYAVAVACGLGAVVGKLHHEYYLLAIAPVIAVGMARGLKAIARSNRWAAGAVGLLLVGLCLAQSLSTFRVPSEWARIEAAGTRVQASVPVGSTVVASEALLFMADRRGARMEFSTTGAPRAAREWQPDAAVADADELVAFYASQGIDVFADLVPSQADTLRVDLHARLRRRYTVMESGPDVLILRLDPP
jgi:4-amino-4-deoxy-L-arabinose transferase-like glycosyltransferase